jgi:GDP-fucose transporter C1
LAAAFIVTAGFLLGLSPSSYFNSRSVSPPTAVALFYGSFSALMTAIHAVLVKSAHDIVGTNSVIKLAYWSNLLSALFLIPCILLNGEIGSIWSEKGRDWSFFILGSAVTGLFGFFLCMAGLLSIKVTSPITHMFSSASVPVSSEIVSKTIVSIRPQELWYRHC